MFRVFLGLLVTLFTVAAVHAGGELLDSMDELRFRVPKDKGKAELVEGKVGKAVQFTFEKENQNIFFTGRLRGTPSWDKAAGLSFWVKGDGSDSHAGLHLIFNDDFAVRYDYCFSIKSKDWTKVTVAWKDLIPVSPGPKSLPLGLPGGNSPSKISAVWFGKWWYWRDYPAYSFAVDELRLEDKIDRPAKDRQPVGQPLERVHAKLKAGLPITIVTMGDSLTDTRHWANRETSWPMALKTRLEAKYKSKITIVNPAIGGTQLRQNLILMPRWLDKTPEPDLVTLCFGYNDWDSGMRGPQFRASYEDAIERIRSATQGKAEALLLSTIPSLDRWSTMAELAEACRAAAQAKNAGLADTEKAFLDTSKEKRERLFSRDRTHLGPVGHELTAQTMLEAIERTGK